MSHVLIYISVFLGPMAEWHQAALVALQRDLKLNVKMFQLSDMLERPAGGFMDNAEALSVKAKTGDMEQMGELISILLGKEDEAFYTFCDLLQRSNYEVWASKLKSIAERLKTVGMLNTCCLHIPYGRKFWRGIYFGGLAVLRAIRQNFIHQNFAV